MLIETTLCPGRRSTPARGGPGGWWGWGQEAPRKFLAALGGGSLLGCSPQAWSPRPQAMRVGGDTLFHPELSSTPPVGEHHWHPNSWLCFGHDHQERASGHGS